MSKQLFNLSSETFENKRKNLTLFLEQLQMYRKIQKIVQRILINSKSSFPINILH